MPTMQAIEILHPGGPEMLQLTTRERPRPGPGEVLIKVAAAGVNRPDVFQRMGNYAPPPGASDLPGLEVAGELIDGDLWGDNPFGLKRGDAVCALLAGGGYAEYAVAPLVQCLPLPAGFSMVEAAALPENYFTVWSNVFERGQLGHGEGGAHESLLVQGGSSGIGVTAIQLAHALGQRVFATAGDAAKCAACERLGATAINYRTQDFVEVVKRATGGRGVDVILDMVAGEYIPREIEALADLTGDQGNCSHAYRIMDTFFHSTQGFGHHNVLPENVSAERFFRKCKKLPIACIHHASSHSWPLMPEELSGVSRGLLAAGFSLTSSI